MIKMITRLWCNCAHLGIYHLYRNILVLGQYRAALFSTWWYWVRRRQYWLIHDGPVWGSTYWYMVAMDQYKAVMVDP